MRGTFALSLLLLLSLLPATAGAAWRSETVPPAETLMITDFGFDVAGRGLLAFEGFRDAKPRKFTGLVTRAADGTWTRRGDLAGVTWGNARTHLYGADKALLVAMKRFAVGRYNRARFALVAAFGRSGGRFGNLVTLDRDGSDPTSDVNARGDAIAGWTRAVTGRVRVAQRKARHRFGRARALSAKGALSPAVAVNARGDAIVAWGRRRTVEARIRRAGRAWGPVVEIGRATLGLSTVSAAISDSGDALVSWGAAAPVSEDGPYRLEHGVGLHDGRWHSARLDRFQRPRFSGVPRVLPRFDPAGRALVAWVGSGPAVRVATVRAGRFDVLAGLPAADAPIDAFTVSPSGALAVSWSVPGGQTGPFVAVSRDGRSFGTATDLHEAGSASLSPSALAFQAETPVIAWNATTAGRRPTLRAAAETP
jgi:hypothetical protein